MEIELPTPKENSYSYGDWNIQSVHCHIMGAKCEKNVKCEIHREEGKPRQDLCNFCWFESLLDLPSFPDMVFASNKLIICYKNGGQIEFNTLDALRQVGKSPPGNIEVAHAKTWKEARADCEFSKRIVKNYDWTFSTSYCGTLTGPLRVEGTEERIDLDKLRVQEEILFYQEIFLFEDELDDNGSTRCVVKVRVMPSGFFVVLRHYLRVDHVLIRVFDTKLYHERGKNGILREVSIRQSRIDDLKIDASTYKNPDLVWQYLNLIKEEAQIIVPR